MFYSHQLLARKAPMGQIWMAARRKLQIKCDETPGILTVVLSQASLGFLHRSFTNNSDGNSTGSSKRSGLVENPILDEQQPNVKLARPSPKGLTPENGGRTQTQRLVDDKERCRGFYTNRQKILLVGEGDFSFASCLATAFRTASNIVATSLDSRDTVITTYSEGERNLVDLELRGAVVIHQVDVHTMDKHPRLRHKLFDRIVFNFPHAGGVYSSVVKETDSWYIICHQLVVSGFFKAAREMVTEDGEIHVTHKTTYPYDMWNVVELAEKAGLVLKREAEFKQWEYPGYVNKKAYKSSRYRCKWDSSFPVGECSTFMFSNIR